MRSDRRRRVAAAILMALAARLAEAGGDGIGSIVYDPTNHLENAVTAAEAVKANVQQLRSYLLQMRQYMAELDTLKTLPHEAVAAILQPYREDVAAVNRLVDELQGLGRDLDDLRKTFDTRLKESAQMRLSPRDYLAREIKLAGRLGGHYAAAVDADARTLRAVNAAYDKVHALQRQVPASVGAQQSFQTMNQHLNLLAGQNAELLALVARDTATRDEQARQAAERRRAAAQEQLERLDRENAAIDALREQVRRSEHATGWGLLR